MSKAVEAEKGREVEPIDPEAPLHQLRERRHRRGRDLKIIITQRDSGTGGGKTTLACWLALSWDDDWTADRSTLDPNEFIKQYPKLPEHSVLILDEAEELDARRSMQEENVQFSKNWMTMRTRQLDSILTLPTSGALDKRLLELADIRINVLQRGLARVYQVKVNDFNTDEIKQRYLHDLKWPDLSWHPEYQRVEEKKQAKIEAAAEAAEARAEADGDTVDPDAIRREYRREIAGRMYEELGYQYQDIEDVLDVSRGTVANDLQEFRESRE
jgi:hypothetical protein